MVTHGYYPTDDGHQLYWERCGTPGGEPIFFLHGGPGSYCNRHHLEFFDLQRFDIVLFDQRGCGRSIPHGELQRNDTGHCVEDIDGLRQHLGFEKISLLGVSWGSWLAIQYQQRYPQALLKTTLVSIFVPFAENVSAYDEHVSIGLGAIHQRTCADNARAIYQILTKGCALQQHHAALHWIQASMYLEGQSMPPVSWRVSLTRTPFAPSAWNCTITSITTSSSVRMNRFHWMPTPKLSKAPGTPSAWRACAGSGGASRCSSVCLTPGTTPLSRPL